MTPVDTAIAAVLLARKKEIEISFATVELVSGIKEQQVMRYLNGHRPFYTSALVSLSNALDIDAGKVIRDAMSRVENTDS